MKYKYILIGIVLCIAIEFVLYNLNHKFKLFEPYFNTVSRGSNEVRENNGVLTNPLLECRGIEDSDVVEELSISKSSLEKYINSLRLKNNAISVSVYIRDLNNGPWIGINEKEEFIGASLLKTPVLIAYYKRAEKEPYVLDVDFKYDKKINNEIQYYMPSHELELGNIYKVSDLIDYMIKYSDNNAAQYLAGSLTEKEIADVFGSVGLGTPVYSAEFPVNTKTYAGFFRVLFNASYLNREYSEKALQILTETEFNEGITKGVPSNIKIAHKFGVRESGGLKQLHDCGIIYYPKHPYLLCIMTKGSSYSSLSSIIASISKYVYEEVSGNY